MRRSDLAIVPSAHARFIFPSLLHDRIPELIQNDVNGFLRPDNEDGRIATLRADPCKTCTLLTLKPSSKPGSTITFRPTYPYWSSPSCRSEPVVELKTRFRASTKPTLALSTSAIDQAADPQADANHRSWNDGALPRGFQLQPAYV